ncbi:MAG: VWA domain-containing protein [Terriglobia bacterium]
MPSDGITRRDLLLSSISTLLASRLARGMQESTLSVDVKVVNLLATVRNKQGQIVRDLNKEDFLIEEDGRTQVIRYFGKETDLALTLGLLVDTSLSQRNLIGQERSASSSFIGQVLREDKDQAFLIHFDREVELLQDLTSSKQRLDAALESLEVPHPSQRSGPHSPGTGTGGHRRGGGTLLYDAVYLAANEVMKRKTGRKALVLLTDGVDTGSRVSLDTAIESAQRSDTLVYSILFTDPQAYSFGSGGYGGPHLGGYGGSGRHGGGGMPYPQRQLPNGKKTLERLSKETGAGFYEVKKDQSIEQIYGQINEELRNQYSLGYTPDRAGAEPAYHRIHLTTKQKHLMVQTREGYYG